MKKYRIRKLSPAWWIIRVGGVFCGIAGVYSCTVLACILAG